MVSAAESFYTFELDKYLAIFPSYGDLYSKYSNTGQLIKKFTEGSSYNSGTNPDFLSVEEIRDLIIKNIDPNFKPF